MSIWLRLALQRRIPEGVPKPAARLLQGYLATFEETLLHVIEEEKKGSEQLIEENGGIYLTPTLEINEFRSDYKKAMEELICTPVGANGEIGFGRMGFARDEKGEVVAVDPTIILPSGEVLENEIRRVLVAAENFYLGKV